MAASFAFKFDIVIVQLHLPDINPEQYSMVAVDVNFNNNNIKITSSRINVNEFKPGRSFQFNERISVLKEKLFKNPLQCHVYYQSQHIGTCTFLWPSSFVNSIAEEYGRELTHCDEADIEEESKNVGKIKIIARLQINCNEFEERQVLHSKLSFCESNDVLFAASETKCGSLACSDNDLIPGSESATSAQATCLDLSDLRHMHGKTLRCADIINFFTPKCCKKQCKELNQNWPDKTNAIPSCLKKASKQELRRDLQTKSSDCISESKYSSSCSTDSYQPVCCVLDEKDRLKEAPSRRCCPLCNTNITWLPKFAACPKCGFRSLLHKVEKKPYNSRLTANDILQQYTEGKAMQQISDVSIKNSQQTFKCRCTCKSGQKCADCRIKELCKDIFRPNQIRENDCDKCEAKSSDLFNICKTNSQTCRPYLMKVFEGLKGLFDMTEGVKNNAVESKGEHRNSLDLQEINKNNKENKSGKKSLDEQRKQFLVKNFQKDKACKNKRLYNDNVQRKYPSSKVGHKTCLAGRKIVPRNMGWLWNAENNRSRIGWMPGAIRKPIKNLMQHFLKNDELYSSHHRQTNTDSGNEENDYTKEATLYICKKEGVYYITLRPTGAVGRNIKPIQFKITKNSFLTELREIKQRLKGMGFPKCTCHKPISLCCCRSLQEKAKLEFQCCKECQNRELPNCIDDLVLSDTTDSETEFEIGVTPPAGMPQPATCFKKRKQVNSGTQYTEGDWNIKPKYPKPLGKYFKLQNCAIGNRFGKALSPYGKKGYSPGAFPVGGIIGPGGKMSIRMQGKHGRGHELNGSDRFMGPDGKFDMRKYLAHKALMRPSKEEIAKRKIQKMELLKGVNPPLLCKVDRRGKPIDTCSAYYPCYAACLSDDRIC